MKTRKLQEASSLSYRRFGREQWQLSKEEKIQFAIENCRRVRITYDDRKGGKGKNIRYLLPLVFGLTNNGKEAVRAFQTFGSTKRGVPKYKLFLMDNIETVELGKVKYYDYEQMLLNTGFNTSGDKSFSKIYAITPLATNYNNDSLSDKNVPIDSKPVEKDDIEPQKQVEKPTIAKKTTKKPSEKLDNLETKPLIKNKMMVPNTKPVTKNDISNVETDNIEKTTEPDLAKQNAEVEKINATETEPVTKKDIENEPESENKPEINKDNKLTNSFNDMMNRMNNLYKDNDENENNEIEDK